jgi:hypothetical protein
MPRVISQRQATTDSGSDTDSCNDQVELVFPSRTQSDDSSTENDSVDNESEASDREDYSVTLGKDGSKWCRLKKAVLGKSPPHAICKVKPGVNHPSKCRTPYECWRTVIDERILRHVVKCSNTEMERCEHEKK